MDGRRRPGRPNATRRLAEPGAAGQRLALAALTKADEVRRAGAQVPRRELGDLRRGGSEGEAGLGRGDVAPLLRDAAEAGGVARGRNRDRAFASAEEHVLRRQASVVGRAGLEVSEEPAVG